MSYHFDKEIPQIYEQRLTFTDIVDATSYWHFVNAKEYQAWELEQPSYVAMVGKQGPYDPATYNILEY